MHLCKKRRTRNIQLILIDKSMLQIWYIFVVDALWWKVCNTIQGICRHPKTYYSSSCTSLYLPEQKKLFNHNILEMCNFISDSTSPSTKTHEAPERSFKELLTAMAPFIHKCLKKTRPNCSALETSLWFASCTKNSEVPNEFYSADVVWINWLPKHVIQVLNS